MFDLNDITTHGTLLDIPVLFYGDTVHWSILDKDGNTHLFERPTMGLVFDLVEHKPGPSGIPAFEKFLFVTGHAFFAGDSYDEEDICKFLKAPKAAVHQAFKKMKELGSSDLVWKDLEDIEQTVRLIDQTIGKDEREAA